MSSRLIPLMVALLCWQGCKSEQEVPEHVLQQRRKERERKKRQEALKKAAEETLKKKEGGGDSYRYWSPEVRRAFYALFRARKEGIKEKTRVLAQMGLPAVDALRAVAAGGHHSAEKQALVSFMLVDLHMFRVAKLAEFAREHKLPFVQRAAVEILARIGNGESEAALNALEKELPKLPLPRLPSTPLFQRSRKRGGGHQHGDGHQHDGHRHGSGKSPQQIKPQGSEPAVLDVPPDKHPIVLWVRQVRKGMKGKHWAYNADQLATLDRVLHADSPQKLRLAVNAIKDPSLDKGLRAIVRTPVARTSVQAGAAFKIVDLVKANRRALRALCGEKEPELVRMQAARELLASPSGRAFLERLAKKKKDPFAPMVQRMLEAHRQKAAKSGK